MILAASLALVSVAPPASQPEYRTVVIFGDTQTVVSGDPVQYADFTKQLDWVIANKYTENIDFVLHVGDIIDLGTRVASVNYFGAVEVLDGLRDDLAHDEARACKLIDDADSPIIAYMGSKHALGRAVWRSSRPSCCRPPRAGSTARWSSSTA
jgi:hypothetical protein